VLHVGGEGSVAEIRAGAKVVANKRSKASPFLLFAVQRILPRTEVRFHSSVADTPCVWFSIGGICNHDRA